MKKAIKKLNSLRQNLPKKSSIKAIANGGIYATKAIEVKTKIDVQSIEILGVPNASNLGYGGGINF